MAKATRTVDDIKLDATLVEEDIRIPKNALGVVLFAHASGRSRHSQTANFIAGILRSANVATVHFDLLNESEEENLELKADIPLLSSRLISATRMIQKHPDLKGLPIGYFSTDTGAAAAICAAAELGPKVIKAIVSQAGHPEIAGSALDLVKSPVLLLVAEEDEKIIASNESAYTRLTAAKNLEKIFQSKDLFEKDQILDKVATLAAQWFEKYLIKWKDYRDKPKKHVFQK
ncbi:MAG: alpha/beta hydrolase [Candidatus Curtissbacteria bacterium]|nr:alpha/beta hydrolase [Candidatus Curtissbacteria bacterium]